LRGIIRLEPRNTGRQLEQQCRQLPIGKSQQQQPGQREQQHRAPPGAPSGIHTARFSLSKDGGTALMEANPLDQRCGMQTNMEKDPCCK